MLLTPGSKLGLVSKMAKNATNRRGGRLEAGRKRQVKVQKRPKMNFHPGKKEGESAKLAKNALSPIEKTEPPSKRRRGGAAG